MKKEKRQAIFCPVCEKGKLIDISDYASAAKLKVFPPEEADKAEWFLKCPRCKQQIGVAVDK